MSGWIEYRLKPRNYVMLYAGLGVVSAALRFYRLGDAPLSASEASSALSAWDLASGAGRIGDTVRLPVSPLLHALQTLSFWLAGNASASLARLWPALSGSMLVFWPIILRHRIGHGAALVAVCFFALSPGLWAVSRTGDGMALALFCGLLMDAGWRGFSSGLGQRGLTLAAVGFGAGLAAGPHFVTMLFLGSVIFMFRPSTLRPFGKRLLPTLPVVMIPAALTFLLSATAFFRYPLGLTAVGESWFIWISNWMPAAGDRPAYLIPVLAILHEPVVWMLGLTGAYMAVRGNLVLKSLVALAGAGLAFSLCYGGRQSADLVWMLLPLTVLASLVVDSAWKRAREPSELVIVGVQTSVLLMMAGFAYVLVAGIASGRSAEWLTGDWDVLVQLAILVILGVLVVMLFASVWSRSLAWCGTITALAIVLAGWSGHARTVLSGGRPETGLDLWYADRASGSAELMLESLEGLSLGTVGESRGIEIAVLGHANDRLAWLLRGFRNVKWARVPSGGLSSPIVIAPGDVSVDELGANYLGQEFSDNVYRQDGPSDNIGWVKYFLFRHASVRQTKLVLWVREDVYLALGDIR